MVTRSDFLLESAPRSFYGSPQHHFMNKSHFPTTLMLVAVATLLACASYSADKPKAKAAANVPPPGTLITSADGVRFVGNQLDALTREGSVLTAK